MTVIWLNGSRIEAKNPSECLISFIRAQGLTGTKLGCAEGGCGSCTVLVSHYDNLTRCIVHSTLNSCLAAVGSLHYRAVVTVEGLGNAKDPHPVQRVLASSHGSQCGFCTPGIVMSLYGQLKNVPHSTAQNIEDAFDGNLCRCTGYRPILDGAKSLLCKHDCQSCDVDCDIEDMIGRENRVSLAFPPELLKLSLDRQSTSIESKDGKWFHPLTLQEVLDILSRHPHAKIYNGNTEMGIEVRFKNQFYPVYVNTFDVASLKTFSIQPDGLLIGACISISNLEHALKALSPNQMVDSLLTNIKYFAGRQIRNVSALSGNICTASPISDLNPVLLAAGAVLTLESHLSKRTVNMSDFFLGYRKTALQPGELLTRVWIPFTQELEFMGAFKQAKRRDDDIAIVNASFKVKIERGSSKALVKEIALAYGGMAATSILATKTAAFLIGKEWNESVILHASKILLEDMPLNAAAPGGQVEFRKTLAQSFLYKFYLSVLKSLDGSLDRRLNSCTSEIPRGLSHGTQTFTPSSGPGVVGKSIVHSSALKQVTGEAVYVDDMPKMPNELYAVIVQSTVAHGRIKSIDASAALLLDGVVDFVSAKDVKGSNGDHHHNHNIIGPVFKDEELFATKKVHFLGQMVGLIIAKSEPVARKASKLVKIEYDVLPALFTIEDAIAVDSFFEKDRIVKTGAFHHNWTRSEITPLENAVHHVKGITRISAQEHFYLETQATLVVPGKEDDELEVFASTQNPTETQHIVAHVLDIPSNRVVCRVKRLGGGFGGKETRSVFLSCALAVAATKHSVPVRCMLTREEDMCMSGTRHPFAAQYDIGFTSEGKLVSAEIDIFANGGYSMDLSLAVLERSITHVDNAYRIPNMKIHGRICKTNTPTNTAFRGFGGPQGLMIAEQYITHVAEYLGKPLDEIRQLNFYKNGEITHFDMPLEDVFLDRAWDELKVSSDYAERLQAVLDYNANHKYRKRGIALMPTKFGLAFTARFLNQAASLVLVYTDGSVRISHGGTEMGQGLHTKMQQIVADAFGISIQKVFLSETRTDVVANTSATAASVSSDLNGMALADACRQINERLEPLRKAYPEDTWEQIVSKAYYDRINLCANGFYKTPDLTFDWETVTGRMFSYFTYGAACTEVEIDTLTGDHVVLRSDIIMDIGRPINPAIDIGQIEGAFTQGLGWCTMEEPLVSPTTGFLFTRGPGLYKIPGFKDIPVDFRVTVMDGVRNTRAIHSSKAVGEPPLFLGASVFFAIKEAIRASRQEHGLGVGTFYLPSPATSERIRLGCQDVFVQNAATPLQAGQKPWGVPL